MGSAELKMVIDMLRSSPILADAPIEELRSGMEMMATTMPPPADVKYEAVDAGGVPAEWTTAQTAQAGRVLVYLHGGGYNIGSVRTHRMLTGALSRAARLPVLSVDYRLAPENRFPAAVDDAVTAYRFVVGSGVAPARIAIAGDSAGGGLTAATLLALRDGGHPLPGGAVCISPWLDLTQSGESVTTRAALDPMVNRQALDRMAAGYLGDRDPRTPTASPLFADLSGLPPILIHVGSSETLLDDSVRFTERLRKAGGDIELEIWEDMIHVFHAFAPLLPEATEGIEKIADFLRRRLG
jgi:acetyl esterase/lipase